MNRTTVLLGILAVGLVVIACLLIYLPVVECECCLGIGVVTWGEFVTAHDLKKDAISPTEGWPADRVYQACNTCQTSGRWTVVEKLSGKEYQGWYDAASDQDVWIDEAGVRELKAK